MKKIISTFAVIAMLVANFATVSFAAVTSETPAKMTGSLTKIDINNPEQYTTEYQELCKDYVDMGLDLYSLKLSVVNSPAEVTFKTMGSKYTGTTITYFSAELDVTTDAILDEEYCYVAKVGAPIPAADSLKYAEGDAASPIDAVTKKSLTAGSTIDLVETIVAIVPGKTFTAKLKAAEVGTAAFNGTVAGQPTADSYTGYIMGASNGLMVLDSAIAGGLTTAEKEDTKVEKYFTATLPACEKADANNAVQFQFNNGTKDGVFNFAFGTLLEAAETVTVGLEVTEVPSDVTVTLNNVVWTTVAE